MAIRESTVSFISIAGVIVQALAIVFISNPPTKVPDFGEFDVGLERKEAFFSYLLPLIKDINQEILQTRQQLIEWRLNKGEMSQRNTRILEGIAKKYRIEKFDLMNEADWNTLLLRVDVIPPSLALAQAASESAWGASRFARNGHNYYGQWCFKKGCGIVPDDRKKGKKHEVASFDSPAESVESYIHNLNSFYAYKKLRNIRAQLRAKNKKITGVALIDGLNSYSTRKGEYINELRAVINYNNLSKYDDH